MENIRKIRKGKDVVVKWPLYRRENGERVPYIINPANAKLRVMSPLGEIQAKEVKFNNNVVEWTFRGSEQEYVGNYTLIFVENDGQPGMVTVDTCKAFALVAHSCEETPDVGGDVVTEAVMLEGDVAFAPVVIEVGSAYDDTELREMIEEQDTKLTELSAEIAKKITNPSIGANGSVLMSLGNGEVKWANILPKSGVFYGYFATPSLLPSASEIGYAYVGQQAPFTIYNYNGGTWQNSGITTYEEDYKRINVRDFGAVGDGVTNDENAIASAFAYAVANLPCEVYFPKGDYGILNGGFPVKIPNGTGGLRIMGDGGNLSRIVYLPEFEMTTGEGWYAIRVQPTTTPTGEDEYIHDISIINMGVYDTDAWNHALNPDLTSGNKEETHGFDIQYAIRAKVEGCFIDSVGDECIDIYSCIDTIVTNNITHNSPAAGNAGGAISIGDGSHNVIVANNIVRGNIATKSNFGIAIESLKIPVSKVVIANNTIANLNGTGVKLSTPNNGASISDVSIVGNIVNGCTYGIGDEGAYEKKNITIASNVLSDIAHTAIYLSKQGSNIIIDGCVIDSCQYAMWLNPKTYINNCTISNIYGYVAMVSSDEVIFDNCKIDNVCQDTTSWVIYIYGDEPIVSVRNCSITNIHSSRGLQKMKNVVNTDIYFTDAGDAVSGVTITEKIVGVRTNGRISVGKNHAMIRDVSIVSENIGSNAITIAANVIGASVLGCYVNIDNYSAIKENSGCDKNLICNNVTNMSVVKVGENSVVQNNIKL